MPVVSVNESFMCEVGARCPSTTGFTGGKKNPLFFFFISLDRISDAKINHQINISSNTTFARTSRKYSFDAKLCMRPLRSAVAQGG